MSGLNPNAASFSFSPGAAAFVPGGGAAAAAAQPAAANQQAAAQADAEKKKKAAEAAAAAAAAEKEKERKKKAAEAAAAAEKEKKKEAAAAAAAAAAATKKSAPTKKKAGKDSGGNVSAAKQEERKELAARKAHDEREHLNVVFIGHVDAGKSTLSGQILLLMGQVDERTIAKYEREAKDKNRESWYLAFIMDINEEERAKGKTVEVGRAKFATKHKRYTLLDAPGHKNYVPNMISGAAQADVGILIISARRGEFEAGFEGGGQTREHATLAKTLGVQRLIVAINKMDEATVKWSQKRYDSIVKKLKPFLRNSCGYGKDDVTFLPISGMSGANVLEPVSEEVCPWFKGDRRSLIQTLDGLPRMPRDAAEAVRVPVLGRYKEMGQLIVTGKVESGTLAVGNSLVVAPSMHSLDVTGLEVAGEEVVVAKPGENVEIKVKGIDEDQLQQGFVLGPAEDPSKVATLIGAQLVVLELLPHKPLLTAGYQCILHMHTLAVECEVSALLGEIDKRTKKRKPGKPGFAKQGSLVNVKITVTESVAADLFSRFPQLGRFTLRDEGKTIAIGKIMKLVDQSGSVASKQ